jgi:alcohol dehydrogenase class IV
LKAFEHRHSGDVIFGNGRISEVGTVVSRYGRRCLIVSGSKDGALRDLYPIVGELLEHVGLEWEQFDGVVPNPGGDLISAGAELARTFKADVILGIGGGSCIDAAKAISIEATHEGTSWDYAVLEEQPISRTLPVVAVGTTAGSGSQVTTVAVITNTGSRDRCAISSDRLIPRAAIVDPQLMLSVPSKVTAVTGFGVFGRGFESILNRRCNPLTELYGWEAISRVIKDLPIAVRDGSNLGARSSLAWADTLAGLAACESGVALPHALAIAIGGKFAGILHGAALISIYQAYLKYTWAYAVSTFARLASILDPALDDIPAADAAEQCPSLIKAFLSRIGLAYTLRDFGIAQKELPALAQQAMVFPDFSKEPRVPTPEDMLEIIAASY